MLYPVCGRPTASSGAGDDPRPRRNNFHRKAIVTKNKAPPPARTENCSAVVLFACFFFFLLRMNRFVPSPREGQICVACAHCWFVYFFPSYFAGHPAACGHAVSSADCLGPQTVAHRSAQGAAAGVRVQLRFLAGRAGHRPAVPDLHHLSGPGGEWKLLFTGNHSSLLRGRDVRCCPLVRFGLSSTAW